MILRPCTLLFRTIVLSPHMQLNLFNFCLIPPSFFLYAVQQPKELKFDARSRNGRVPRMCTHVRYDIVFVFVLVLIMFKLYF